MLSGEFSRKLFDTLERQQTDRHLGLPVFSVLLDKIRVGGNLRVE